MKAAPVSAPNYDARIRRADLLASRYLFASEILTFYRHIAKAQQQLYSRISSHGDQRHVPSHPQLRSADLSPLWPHFQQFLRDIKKVAPAPVAEAAQALADFRSERLVPLLTAFWQTETNIEDAASADKSPLAEFCFRAFSEPYAEFLAQRMPELAPSGATPRECPRCASAPLLGVLRPEGDGAKRFLLCSFCLQEWDFRRIYCPACGEEDEKKLPVYVAEQFPHIRVECCDTCHTFLRTIDLTKDGHAIPIVDDLAALPLSLWAYEHHYFPIHTNLLST